MYRADQIRYCLCCLVVLLVLSSCKDQQQLSLQEYSEESMTDASVDEVFSEADTMAQSYIDVGVTEMADQADLYVFVCGCVVVPGVYQLPVGSRVYDGILLAGGLTEEADIDAVNQARLLSDGEKVYIPAKGEDYIEAGSEYNEHGIQVSEASSGLVNLNRASKDELLTLPGIGESKADAIIDYRDQHGGFRSKEELMNISGIKEGVYHKIEAFICVD